MPAADRLYAPVEPFNRALALWLTQRLGAPLWQGSVYGLLAIGELAVLALLLTRLGAALTDAEPLAADHQPAAKRMLARTVAALVATALFSWSVRVGSDNIYALFSRWDHLVFCAAAGCAMRDLSTQWRRHALSALSLYFVAANVGWLPSAIVCAGGLAGFTLLRFPGARHTWVTVVLQSAAMLATFAVIWVVRSRNLWAGLAGGCPSGC